MNTINITTTQNIALEYELASLGDRILGRLLDLLIIGAFCLIVFAFIGFGNIGQMSNANTSFIFLFLGIPVVFYDLLSEMLLNGQSFGKKIMGIKVISLTGSQATFSQYLIRWLFRSVDFSLTGSLAALITVSASEKKQRIGDMVAGTVLVKTKPRTSITDTIYHAVERPEYTVTYPEVINLKDQDMQVIKDVLKTVYETCNTPLAWQTQQKIEQVLGIASHNTDAMNFLKTVLLDYNYLAGKM